MKLLQFALTAVLSATPLLGMAEMAEAHPSPHKHNHRRIKVVYANNRCGRPVRIKLRWYAFGKSRVANWTVRPGIRRLTHQGRQVITKSNSVSWKIYYRKRGRWGKWVRTKDTNNDRKIQFPIYC